MRWIEALKIWNKSKKDVNPDHVWMSPRKGTEEHAQVKSIMARAKPEAVEARNVERRMDALSRLRAEEAKTNIRNLERKAAAEKIIEAARKAMAAKASPKMEFAPVKVKKAAKKESKPAMASEARVRRNIGAYMAVSDQPSDELKIKILKYIAKNSENLEDTSGDRAYYDQEFAIYLPKVIYKMLETNKAFRDGLLKSVNMLFRDLEIERSSFKRDKDIYSKEKDKYNYYISLQRSDLAGEDRSAHKKLLETFKEDLKLIGKLSKGGFKAESAALKGMESDSESDEE